MNGGVHRWGYRLILLFLGLYFVGGGVYSFLSNKWFPGFPLQFDWLSVLPFGNLIEATVGALLGVILIVAALYRRKQPAIDSGSVPP